jgi:hypothetical protein
MMHGSFWIRGDGYCDDVFITGVNEANNAIQDSYCWDLNENSFS